MYQTIYVFTFALLANLSIYGNTIIDVDFMLSVEERQLTIDYLNFEPESTTVTILDKNQNQLYQVTKKHPNLLPKQFKIDEQIHSSLVLIIESRVKSVETSFQFLDGQLIQTSPTKKTFKPSIRQTGKEVLINLLNPTETPVKIRILDEDGSELVAPMMLTEKVVRRTIDFKQFRSTVTIIVENGITTVREFIF